MTYLIDIDGVICSITNGHYSKAQPYKNRIRVINSLYDRGHKIKLFTARGTTLGINLRRLTEVQLKDWGVKYHELILGKPEYDISIDDKAINMHEFFENMRLFIDD